MVARRRQGALTLTVKSAGRAQKRNSLTYARSSILAIFPSMDSAGFERIVLAGDSAGGRLGVFGASHIVIGTTQHYGVVEVQKPTCPGFYVQPPQLMCRNMQDWAYLDQPE